MVQLDLGSICSWVARDSPESKQEKRQPALRDSEKPSKTSGMMLWSALAWPLAVLPEYCGYAWAFCTCSCNDVCHSCQKLYGNYLIKLPNIPVRKWGQVLAFYTWGELSWELWVRKKCSAPKLLVGLVWCPCRLQEAAYVILCEGHIFIACITYFSSCISYFSWNEKLVQPIVPVQFFSKNFTWAPMLHHNWLLKCSLLSRSVFLGWCNMLECWRRGTSN